MRPQLLLVLALTTCCPPAGTIPVAPPVVAPPVTSPPSPPSPTGPLSLETLAAGVSVHGFTPAAVYLDGSDQPIGARFVHDKTKFTFDYLRIESAPQGYLWVNSFPTSDKGEPHTQEHLLLGKGDRGRKMGSFQAMALAESSAFTDQWRTVYHFHTVAGREAFWPVFADQLGAMLDADYTDEEIRREVRNFGVDKDDAGKLRLEEKGTVYNEMVRSYEDPERLLWDEALRVVYGPQHPLALSSGGLPDAIRTMTIGDIRTFHTANYHLANMGMIAAFPSAMTLTDVLDQTGLVLAAANPRTGKVTTEASLPKATPLQSAAPVIIDYPYSDTTSPSPVMMVWPATRQLDLTEHTLMGLFLDAFAGDESTPLYKLLIDSKTRTIDLGASGVGVYTGDDVGQPIFLSIGGVRSDRLDPDTLGKIRALIASELQRIATLPDGAAELAALRDRVQSRMIDLRRQVSKFLDSPPGFGIRGTGASWDKHLHALSRTSGFRKSLTLRPELAAIEKVLAASGNPWRDRLKTWGLLDAPTALAARPSPKLRKRLDTERDQRNAAELVRLEQQYKTKGAAATLGKYQVDYDAQTKILDDASAKALLPQLVKSPPMTLDDELAYTTTPIGGVPAFAATIDSMQSARVSLAFRVDVVPEADLMYLAGLPSLISDVGIADGTTVIASETMRERLRKEILELSVGFDHDLRTRRVELVVSGAGNDVEETKLAIAWMGRAMFSADWRIENLPRLRDLVDQSLTALRGTMKGAEESWVHDPQEAWWRQDQSTQMHTGSFLTQAHDLHRLRWQLLDPHDPKVTEETARFLATLADAAKLPRATLVEIAASLADPKIKAPPRGARWVTAAAALSPGARALVVHAGKDLTALLPELPDSSVVVDWTYLCKQMAKDLTTGAPAALAKLDAVRDAILATSTARVVTVGSPASQKAIAADLAALVGRLDPAPRPTQTYATRQQIKNRMRNRDYTIVEAFTGLVAPGTSSGVFINTDDAPSMLTTSDSAILNFLASNQYTGHGAHSLFMKTWAAGLAYSNGVRIHEQDGRIEYYAERCPLLPTTLKFVIAQLRAAKPDANIARYAVASAFDSRIATGYESRAWQMAANLVDGLTPEVVRAFRTRVLAVAEQPNLAVALHARLPEVYARVIPGFAKQARTPVSFVIGPPKQLDAYEAYLKANVSKDAQLARIYPRDFWYAAKL